MGNDNFNPSGDTVEENIAEQMREIFDDKHGIGKDVPTNEYKGMSRQNLNHLYVQYLDMLSKSIDSEYRNIHGIDKIKKFYYEMKEISNIDLDEQKEEILKIYINTAKKAISIIQNYNLLMNRLKAKSKQ